jgi:hypothetical protein
MFSGGPSRSGGRPLARYGWELVAPDGTVAVGGTDIVEFAADGHLGRIIGFFGDLA